MEKREGKLNISRLFFIYIYSIQNVKSIKDNPNEIYVIQICLILHTYFLLSEGKPVLLCTGRKKKTELAEGIKN